MFERISPEQAGISSRHVLKLIRLLNRRGLAMHSVLMMRGNSIFAEYYWKPFHKDRCHRMYSQTKSYVAVAIGLLEEDGLLRLDDPIAKYFPEKIDRELPPYLKAQTIRQMLTMETCGSTPSWFRHSDPDRTHLYFSTQTADHPAGLTFDYDSPGSQVLTALAEKLAGMPLFDFLNQRIFRHLGTFRTATILKVKNGDSWGDSALLCTSRDMASFARFVMNYGTWNGRRLMNEAYLRSATTAQVDSDRIGFHDIYTDGYGYQIWIVPNGFSFNGMGCQLTFCIPEKDFIFVCTADNQGYASAKSLIATALYEEILENMQDAPLPEDPEGCRACLELESKLDLVSLEGGAAETMAQTVQGKTYICRENPAGIREFSLSFPDAHTGVLRYVNAQGEKHLTFGLGKNAFGKFPQQGYSTSHGGLPDTDGYLYDCAASGVWSEPGKLKIKVQIIDRYLGNVLFSFSFRDDVAHLTMVKTAEDFLEEYQGSLVAYAQN